ncbi:MAG: TetR/AcrR family transcriptional regulator [Pseudomonadota bacterium]
MDTKTRILKASLALFNEEGEDNQAAIDIANALEISPGNLYYHFKGKDAIIHALFDEFEEELRIVLAGAERLSGSPEDLWVYLHILADEIWDFRFFYLNLVSLLRRYPDLARRFRRLTEAKRGALSEALQRVEAGGGADFEGAALDLVVDQILYRLIFWPIMAAVDGRDEAGDLVDEVILHCVSAVAPYLTAAEA